jgi:prolyl 4-hydroxylase
MEIVIILLLILLLIIFKGSSSSPQSNFKKNHGFANIKEKYTKPEIVKDIVTEEEADYIITEAKKLFKESLIIGSSNKADTSIRKSKTAWLYTSDPIVHEIVQRVCDRYNYPIENAEPMQVVQYESKGFYKEHHDACCDNDPKCTEFVQNGGQRILTCLIYLNDDFTGGSTDFPELGVSIKPPKYSAIVFRPLENDGNRCHPLALHKGTEVTSGIKYICNIWIRQGEYSKS